MIFAWVLLVASTRTPILTYHDIIPKRRANSVWFDCTVQEFRDQIAWLRKRGAVFVSTHDIYEALEHRRTLPTKAICITFADNYEGFYKYAWPILRKEKIPVTQFVHTGFVGSKVGRPKMTWAQLKELSQSGLVSVASQTVSHPADLTTMSDEAVTKEFTKSRESIAAHIGHPTSELAYPNGKYDARVAALASATGYRIAFTEDCRPAETAKGLFTVPRYVHTKYRQAWADKELRN